jgi:hypothetical protein
VGCIDQLVICLATLTLDFRKLKCHPSLPQPRMRSISHQSSSQAPPHDRAFLPSNTPKGLLAMHSAKVAQFVSGMAVFSLFHCAVAATVW